MKRFEYRAVDGRGRISRGAVLAASSDAAALDLRARGEFPIEIGETAEPGNQRGPGAGAHGRPGGSTLFAKQPGDQELAVFMRQLASLLHAGMPLVHSLDLLGRQERNDTFRETIESLASGLRGGSTLAVAMGGHPRVFGRLVVGMVRAGETGGVLDLVVARLAQYLEKTRLLKAKVRSAMMYPAIVMAVSLAILSGLLVFVVPRFQLIFADLLRGAPLPPLTEAVLAISEFVRGRAAWMVAGGVAGWLALDRARRTDAGRRWIDGVVLRLPVAGDLVARAVTARFCRTLGTLLSGGVPVLTALGVARDTCGNARIAEALDRARERVKGGDTLAAPVARERVFPPMVAGMIEVGEQTGRLPEMLVKIADIYDEEVDTSVAGLTSLVEPVMIVILAGVVGTIVVALFLPIVRIVQLLS